MPSFKACFAALALVAMTFAPLADAKATHAGVAKRGDHADKRALAKAAAAKRAGARKAAKVERAASTDIYTLSGFNKGTLAAAANRRCANDAACSAVTAPANAEAVCVSFHCTIHCDAGFAPTGPDTCTDTRTCGTTTCPTVTGGYNTCSGNTCEPACYAGTGLFTSTDGSLSCVDTLSDPNNCGGIGFTCPQSYNGLGTPRCFQGSCTLTCPAYTNPRSAQSTTNPKYCA